MVKRVGDRPSHDMSQPTSHIDTHAYTRWIDTVEQPRKASLPKEYPKASGWPLISVVMPTCNTPETFLRAALDSVLLQRYPHWQLCIADDASTAGHVRGVLESYAERDHRVSVGFRASNGGIAAATNSALELAEGDHIALLDHDDMLPEHSLAAVATCLRRLPGTGLLYTDSDSLDDAGQRCDPFFKPDWNYELFLGQNYLNHLSVYRSSLIRALGGLREGFDGSQDYDLALRAIEQLDPDNIVHLPEILYHWRTVETSVARSNLKEAVAAARSAVGEHLLRTDRRGEVRAARNAIIHNRIVWHQPQPQPSVGVIVHGNTGELANVSAAAIRESTRYDRVELKPLALSGDSADPQRRGELLNLAAGNSDSAILCFVAAGLVPMSDDWLSTLVAQAMRSSIGMVGTRIVSDRQLLGPLIDGIDDPRGGGVTGVITSDAGNAGYFSRLALDQQATAVHGAGICLRRDIFARSGGFDPGLSSLLLLGADLSLRIARQGLHIIWSAQVSLQSHHDKDATDLERLPEPAECAIFTTTRGSHRPADPFYNRNLSRRMADFTLPTADETADDAN